MADIELVIKIPEEIYKASQIIDVKYEDVIQIPIEVITNSTPLPKVYGRLIDADEVVKEICIEYKVNSIYELPNELRSFIKKYLNEVPTILKPTVEYMIKNYAFSKSEG